MKRNRRSFLAASMLAAPALLRPGRARAAEVTLKLAHFLPPVAPAHAKLLKPWAEQVEAASDGRISIRIYPSMQLGGTPPQLFDQVRDGVADIVWTLPGYTPGRFPRLETFELPFLAAPTAVVNAQAVQEFTATECRCPMYVPNSASNCFVLGPVVSHPPFSVATTSSISSCPTLGL